MLDHCKIFLQYLLPKYRLSQLAGWFAERPAGLLMRFLIRFFIGYYRVNMQEAERSDPAAYKTFNDFFTRRLRPGARSFVEDEDWLAAPVDGTISQLGIIDERYLLQAKGHRYQLEHLLAADADLAEIFRGGQFATLYLSPRDYHRVHMPCNGLLRQMIHVPGDRFSVNGLTATHVPNLFARNERVITLFETPFGPMAQILVGAAIVGGIAVAWAGRVVPSQSGITRWTYQEAATNSVWLKRGEEMGHFKLGSTVINLFAPNKVRFASHLEQGNTIMLGEKYAQCASTLMA